MPTRPPNPSKLWDKKRAVVADAFVDAAEQAFGKHGYERTTMAEIARAAGCAAGTLYLYFKSKEELFNAMVTKHASAIGAAKRAALESAKDPLEGVRGALATVVDYFNSHRSFFRVFYEAEPGARPNPQACLHEEAFTEYLATKKLEVAAMRRAQKLGHVRSDFDADELVDFMHGFGMAQFSRWALSDKPPSPRAQLDHIWNLSLGGIRGER